HQRRGLPRWERLGHPLDTLSVAGCYGWLVATGPGSPAPAGYLGGRRLLLPARDERRVRARSRVRRLRELAARYSVPASPHRLSRVRLHLVVRRASVGHSRSARGDRRLWHLSTRLLELEGLVEPIPSKAHGLRPVNNALYSALGARWYDADDDPVALLRDESRLRNPRVGRHVTNAFGTKRAALLAVGCGPGFLSNHLAMLGPDIPGLAASRGWLGAAARHDATGT